MGQGAPNDPQVTANQSDGQQNANVSAGAGTTIINPGSTVGGKPGRLCRVIVLTAGTTGNLTFYDSTTGATGNILGVVPGTTAAAGATIGTTYTFNMPYINGLAAVGAANSPGVAVSWF